MARLNQTLLHKVAKRLGKKPQYIREQVSRRASREAVSSDVALIMWARDLSIGVASALNKVPPNVQQQLSVSRAAVPPRPRSPRPRVACARAGAGRRAADSAKAKLVFVSHASEDKKLAGALVELLRSALNMPADRVLCTSVDGYRLPAGRDADEALRQAVLAARTLVGIISPASQRSTYVQAEIGGRWVTRKHIIPVTAGGVSPGQVRGPAGRLNALDLSSRPNVQQLISDLGTELRIEPERPEVFATHVERVVEASKAARKRSKPRRRAR
jgi:hypothetical protein